LYRIHAPEFWQKLSFKARAKIHARIQRKQGFWKRRKRVLEVDRKHLFRGRKTSIFQLGGLVWEGSITQDAQKNYVPIIFKCLTTFFTNCSKFYGRIIPNNE